VTGLEPAAAIRYLLDGKVLGRGAVAHLHNGSHRLSAGVGDGRAP
jgi:hypothetical protein